MATTARQRIEQLDANRNFKAPVWAIPQQFPTKFVGVEMGTVVDIVLLKPEPFHVIGRHEQLTHVCIPGRTLSRRHAVLVHDGERGEVFLADLSSSNGTFINGAPIEPLELYKISIFFFFFFFHPFSFILFIHFSFTKFYQQINIYVYLFIYKAPYDIITFGIEPIEYHIRFERTEKRPRASVSSHTSAAEHEQQRPAKKPGNAIRCSHLLVKHKDSRHPSSWREKNITRTKEEALELIKGYQEQLKQNPERFGELAAQYSDCSSAKHKGDLGFFPRGKMQKPFEDAAFSLNVGEISGPVFSDSGIHLILRTA